jgi:hypothetical protein
MADPQHDRPDAHRTPETPPAGRLGLINGAILLVLVVLVVVAANALLHGLS